MLVAVAVGGALGTMARYEVALAEPVGSGRFPGATFVVNVVGSLALGIVVVVWADERAASRVARAFVAVGICGGLTTFSTWMVESVLLTRDDHGGVAVLYLVVSLVVGLLAVTIGVTGARRVLHRPAFVFEPEQDD